MRPPLLPAEALRRTLRVARLDGTSMLAIAGIFALASAAGKDIPGAAVGLLVAGAGAVELHGAGMVRGGVARGVNWLIGSQLYLMVVILTYVAVRLQHVDVEPMRALITTEQRDAIKQAGLTVDTFLLTIYRIAYEAVGGATVIYQGAMALYYVRRRAPITAALAESAG